MLFLPHRNLYLGEPFLGAILVPDSVNIALPHVIAVYASRKVIPNYAALNQIMPELGAKVTRNNPGIKCVEPGYCFNVYLDGEYRDTDINVEICEAVISRGKDAEGIVFKELPAVTVVSVLHQGAYETLGEAYAYAMQWVEQNGYQITIQKSYQMD